MKKRIITEIICCIFILLWLYAGINKILDHDHFKFQLGRSPVLQPLAGIIAWGVPAGELLMAVAFVFYTTRVIALYTSFFAMVLFTVYIAAMLKFSYYVPCSCTGFIETFSWPGHMVFNSILVVLLIVAILFYSKNEPLKDKTKDRSKTN